MTRIVFLLPVLLAADVRPAVEHFQNQRYREASAAFAACDTLTPDQTAAWAYCRLRLAAEAWNTSKGEDAKGIIAEATAALRLVPEHAELQAFGGELIRAAGGTPPKVEKPKADSGWFSLESDNFRVRYPALSKELAEVVSAKAEEQRTAIFTRWSGPPGGAWAVKCEIVLHPSAKDFAHATTLSEAATGHALVHMDAGKATLRRIDVRSDDDSLAIDALPRELTHIVLADLFPGTPPPKWAADGMATLAMSSAMVDRYLATAAALKEKKMFPSAANLVAGTVEDPTSRAVASAAMVEMLVKLKGERSLTIFLRDSQRYGLEKGLERQYGFTSIKDLDRSFK